MENISINLEKGIVTIEAPEKEGGGWTIIVEVSTFSLYEYPQFGGEPYLIQKFGSLYAALKATEKLT